MLDIKFKHPTDEDIAKADKYKWDITIGKNHEPMQLVRLEDCIHTIGGEYGNNDLYVHPRNEQISLGNLTEFNAGICWGYDVQQRNYYAKDEIRQGTFTRIYCGGKQVYEFRCGWDLTPHKVMMVISQLKEHPLDIWEVGYEDKVVGRKVWFKDKPAIITMYMKEQGSIMLEPDGDVDKFGKACYETDEEYEWGYEGDIKEDILADSIYWFRD